MRQGWFRASIILKKRTMRIYEFTIRVEGIDPDAADLEDRFYEAGCDDATISVYDGNINIEFYRESNSLAAAIKSALKNVLSAGVTITTIFSEPEIYMDE